MSELVQKIRPAGKHILTIGRDLIKDEYAAIVELVKNAFDADSTKADISIIPSNGVGFTVTVRDNGHGMSSDTVISKWLVPSTNDKEQRRYSPSGRILQGRKGIGRFAASILGDDLLLETVSEDHEKTTVYLQWAMFESTAYLDEVDVLVESQATDESSGTTLSITSNNEYSIIWKQSNVEKLMFELKKLIPPRESNLFSTDDPNDTSFDQFQITLTVCDSTNGNNSMITKDLTPFPILDLYDYRIFGKVDQHGIGSLTYTEQKAQNTISENISFTYGHDTCCGEVVYDIRVYDRDKDSIDRLISRGLQTSPHKYLSNIEAKKLLDSHNGVGVYRNNFRIRPLGDPDNDWLELNKNRVQNPSLRIGSDQVIGFVHIQAEDKSGLFEKSARDGLRDNQAYCNLKVISSMIISLLETRRFEFRRKSSLYKPALKIERDLEKIFMYNEVKLAVQNKLKARGVEPETSKQIIQILSDAEEKSYQIIDEIRRVVSIYQGQATLGKIVNIILHEARGSLHFFKNEVPILEKNVSSYFKTHSYSLEKLILKTVTNVGVNSDKLSDLFKKIQPLATTNRGAVKEIPLCDTIGLVIAMFQVQFNDASIKCNLYGPPDFQYPILKRDVFVIFVNLIDNSVFWMNNRENKTIEIEVNVVDGALNYIDYRDSGVGIEPFLISSGVIFEPEFTTKPDGMGLGLAIAGEIASKYHLNLKALESQSGAYFRLERI